MDAEKKRGDIEHLLRKLNISRFIKVEVCF